MWYPTLWIYVFAPLFLAHSNRSGEIRRLATLQ